MGFVVLPFAVGSCEKGGECALDTGSTWVGGACEKGNYDESACASFWTATPGLSTATCCAHDYCTFSDDGLSWGLGIFLAAVVAPIMCCGMCACACFSGGAPGGAPVTSMQGAAPKAGEVVA